MSEPTQADGEDTVRERDPYYLSDGGEVCQERNLPGVLDECEIVTLLNAKAAELRELKKHNDWVEKAATKVLIERNDQAAELLTLKQTIAAYHETSRKQAAELRELREEKCAHGWKGSAPKDGARITDPCPACGLKSLFIGSGGGLTCSSLQCTEPGVSRSIEALRTRAEQAEARKENLYAQIAELISEQQTAEARIAALEGEREQSEALTIEARTQRNAYRAQVEVYRPRAGEDVQALANQAGRNAPPALPVVVYPATPTPEPTPPSSGGGESEDTKRLDWLEQDYNGDTFSRALAQSWREAIDAARPATEQGEA